MNRRSFFHALCGVVVAPVAAVTLASDSSSVFGLSASDTTDFGHRLFQIARDTQIPFTAVRDAAAAFARQGLGAEETLRRTQDAMVLSRLSGLATTESVERLTRAVNDFSRDGLASTRACNQFAVVDKRFAVSSQEMERAIRRIANETLAEQSRPGGPLRRQSLLS